MGGAFSLVNVIFFVHFRKITEVLVFPLFAMQKPPLKPNTVQLKTTAVPNRLGNSTAAQQKPQNNAVQLKTTTVPNRLGNGAAAQQKPQNNAVQLKTTAVPNRLANGNAAQQKPQNNTVQQRQNIVANRSVKNIVQKRPWFTPFATVRSLWRSNAGNRAQNLRDLLDPRRARLNPINMIAGYRNYRENSAPGTNYHSNARHGAFLPISEAARRLQGTLRDYYSQNNAMVPQFHTQGRFNSESWEAYSWETAKRLFANNLANQNLVGIQWVGNDPNPGALGKQTWQRILQFNGEDVGTVITANQTTSTDMVRVAINYRIIQTPQGQQIVAWNGQMFPCPPNNNQQIQIVQVAPPIGIVERMIYRVRPW